MSGRMLPGLATPGNATTFHAGSQTIPDFTMDSIASAFDPEAAEAEQLYRQNGGVRGGSMRERTQTSRSSGSRTPVRFNPPALTNRDSTPDISQQASLRSSRSRTPTAGDGTVEQEIDLAASARPSSRRWLTIGNATAEDDTDDLMGQKSVASEISPQFELSNEDALRSSKGGHRRSATGGPEDVRTRRPRASIATATTESTVVRDAYEQNQMSAKEQAEATKKMRAENMSFKIEIEMMKLQLHGKVGESAANAISNYITAKAELAQQKGEYLKLQRASKTLEKEVLAVAEERDEAHRELAKLRQRDPRGMEALQKQLEDERDGRAAAEEQIRQLEDELDYAEQNRPGDQSLENLAAELEDMKQQLSDATQAQEEWKTRYEDNQDSYTDLQAELARVVDERDRAVEDLATRGGGEEESEKITQLTEELADIAAAKASLEAELDAIRTGVKVRDEQRLQDTERIARLTNELDQTRLATSKFGEFEEQNEKLERLLRIKEDELLNAKEVIDQLEDKLHAQSTQLEMCENELDRLGPRLRDLERERQELDDNLNEAMGVINDRNETLQLAREEIANLQEELFAMTDQRDKFKQELVQADSDIDRVDETRDQLENDLADMENQLISVKEMEASAKQDLEEYRSKIDEQSRKLGDLEVRHRQDLEMHRKLVQERDDVQSHVKRSDLAHSEETRLLRKELTFEIERYKQLISDKEQSNMRLTHEVEIIRERIGERDRDVRDLQSALKDLESDKRKIGDNHLDDRRSLELEIDRVKRDLTRKTEELERAYNDIDRLESAMSEQKADLSDLEEEKLKVENQLTSERQERLRLSDKLVDTEKAARRAEAELDSLHDKIAELESSVNNSRTLTPRKVSDVAQKDAMGLLQNIYIKVAKICGIEEHGVPSNFATLKDNLLRRVRQMQFTNSEWERQIRALENRLESQTSALSRELDAKKKLLDGVDHSVQKMAQTKLSWKTKLTMKDDEVADLRARLKDLQSQLSSLKITTTSESSTEIKTLQSRATHAEKRAGTLANQLSALQESSSLQDNKHQMAVNKWEARVREYEKRLREAGEMIKVEKQGGKERVAELEQQLRALAAQRDAINAKTVRLESIMNAAGMGRREDPDAL